MIPRVLTVRPPWAQAIILRDVASNKDIENRTWSISPQRIAVHAGRTIDEEGLRMLGDPPHLELDRGVILGTVDVTGCHPEGSIRCLGAGCSANPWAMWTETDSLWHWELEHPREFVTPIRAVGQLGLWDPGPSIAHLIEIAEVKL